MLKHIVMWRYKDGVDGKTALEHSAWMKENLEALMGVVPELHSLEYGIDVLRTPSSYDGVLTVTVDDIDALSRYANHPEHPKIVDYAKRVADPLPSFSFRMTLYPKLITDVLANVRYPGNGKSIIETDMLDDQPHIDGMKVSFSIVFDKNPDPFMKSLFKSIEASIHREISPDVEVEITPVYRQTERPELEKLLPGVKNIIAVSSGKGGVGKSTVSANLAVALAAQGYEVGLLDADVFGPSMPKRFSLEDEAIYAHIVEGRQLLIPALKYGVKLLSVGFFVNPQTATLWRGSMASNTLKQLIADADWGELDYLIIDTPPGTSDIHLTLLQTLAITGAVIVSTPQEVALADARKGIDMYRNEKINVPILGLVENMAWFTPAELPNNRYYIFGREGATRLAEELGVPVLAQIPIVQSICDGGDSGLTIRPGAFFVSSPTCLSR